MFLFICKKVIVSLIGKAEKFYGSAKKGPKNVFKKDRRSKFKFLLFSSLQGKFILFKKYIRFLDFKRNLLSLPPAQPYH